METTYFITQPTDASGILPTSTLGYYCKSTDFDISCTEYTPMYVSKITKKYAIAKDNSHNTWALIDNSCNLVATTDSSGIHITSYSWHLPTPVSNIYLGKIVIDKVKKNTNRISGRFVPLCTRCPSIDSPCHDFTYSDLAERRKAEILKYQNNFTTNKGNYSQKVKKKTGKFAMQTETLTNFNLLNLPVQNNILIYNVNTSSILSDEDEEGPDEGADEGADDGLGEGEYRITKKELLCNCSNMRFGRCNFLLCLNPKIPYTKK